MPRPKNKSELLVLSQQNFELLIKRIEDLPKEVQQRDFPEGTLNRNIRDVLMHLHHWHKMFLEWYTVGMADNKPHMPAKGYTWKTTPDLNKHIQSLYTATTLKDAKSQVTSSHQAIRALIETHSNEELFEKKRYHWTGSTSLGAYLISATSSHYEWAIKFIKKAVID